MEILYSDLPEDYAEVADVIGLENALALIRARGGESLYVPSRARIELKARDRQIAADFDGANYRELARQHGLSVNRVRQLTSHPLPPRRKAVDIRNDH